MTEILDGFIDLIIVVQVSLPYQMTYLYYRKVKNGCFDYNSFDVKYSVGHSLFIEVIESGMGILSISMGYRQRYSCHLTDSFIWYNQYN